MLKALPCGQCGAERGLSAMLPDGGVHALAFPPTAPYRCSRCRTQTRLTPAQFNALPYMTFKELKEAGLVETILQDLDGLTEEQLAQVYAAGVPLGTLHPTPPPARPTFRKRRR